METGGAIIENYCLKCKGKWLAEYEFALKIKRTDHDESFDFVKDICIFRPPRCLPCISEIASKLSCKEANLTRAMFFSAQWFKSSTFSTLPNFSKACRRTSTLQ
jgi:hypothetical protein